MISFTIPGELTDLNTYISAERRNKFMAAKIKREETERVAWEIKRQRVPSVQKVSHMQVTWYTKDLKKDADNCQFAVKFILDGLVLANVLENDSRRHTGACSHIMDVDAKNPRVEIILTLPLFVS